MYPAKMQDMQLVTAWYKANGLEIYFCLVYGACCGPIYNRPKIKASEIFGYASFQQACN